MGIQGQKAELKKGRHKKTNNNAPKEITPSYEEQVLRDVPVVGLGASAGGLEAFTRLLKVLPADTGLAFIFVQHQAPKHESMLTGLISRETQMQVLRVEDGMVIKPNHVYVIPPGVDMAILHGKLSLMEYKSVTGQHMPIDYFFRSLAKDKGPKAIGVVLSGTASDGTMGLQAIKAEGGLTFAQDTESAKYDGMPRNAIVSGCVDFILTPEGIADELVRVSRYPYVAGKPVSEEASASRETLDKIFIILRNATGVDFTYYKPATIKRRIKRRMVIHKIERTEDYFKYIQRNPSEIEALYQEMLINVTSFFREPESFEALKEKVFPALVKKSLEVPIRIWVPGCSTGEEPYSIAMCLLEYLGEKATSTQVQIFATDIDDQALERARIAKYSENIVSDISPERLKRFFLKIEKGYQVSKQIRDMCIFAKHNIIKDPPFSKLDLLSCRNVLIYLESTLQKKLLPIFHYALNPSGALMLGSSETIGEFGYLFSLLDKKSKIYAKKSVKLPHAFEFTIGEYKKEAESVAKRAEAEGRRHFDIKKELERIILASYAPASVVINSEFQVLHFSGHTSLYLEHAPGEASLNILKMARNNLMFEIRKSVDKATREGVPVKTTDIMISYDDKPRPVAMEIIPIGNQGSDKYFVIIFQDMAPSNLLAEQEITTHAAPKSAKKDDRKTMQLESQVTQLKKELSSTKEYLQSIIEEQESANEELRSANEEIQSTNEELQSTNEELETAKEELQSTNEELNTVNEELENRNIELSRLNDDLNNLLSSFKIPLLILDREFKIRRFTSMSERVLNLLPSDIGRPIADIRPNISVMNIDQLAKEVVQSMTVKEQEVQDQDGRWFNMRIMPYRTSDNRIDGTVLLFIDIDDLKHSFAEAERVSNYARSVIAAVRQPILVLDSDLRVASASASFYDLFGVKPEEAVGTFYNRLQKGRLFNAHLRDKLEEVSQKDISFTDFHVDIDTGPSEHKKFNISGRPVIIGLENKKMILLEFEEQ